MLANPGFPLSLDVRGWPCLVLGGDEEAAEKTLRLLEAGAKVTVVSPTLNETLRNLAASAKVIHRPRTLRTTDLDSMILVLNLTRDRDVSRSLLEVAREKRFLLWSVDQPEASTVIMPAVLNRGHFRIAVSTSGVAPGLSGFLREDMEKIFDDEFAAFVEWLGQLREQAKTNEPDAEKRRALLREALDGFQLVGQVRYPKVWLDERAKQKA